MASGTERRLSALEKEIGSKLARWIVIKVPTKLIPIPGSIESDGVVTPETEAQVDEILHAVGVTDQDTVVAIAHFYEEPRTNGGSEPAPIPVTELISVT